MTKNIYFVVAALCLFTGINCFAGDNNRPDLDTLAKKVHNATYLIDNQSEIKTQIQTGIIDMPAQKFKANVTVEYDLPDKCRITSILNNGEKNVQIINGSKAWELKDGKVREIKGKELDYLIFNTELDASRANWKELFSKVVFENDEKVKGRECYVLRCVPVEKYNIKTDVVFYVDKKEFLIRRIEMSSYSQAGILREIVTVDAFKEMNKQMIPVVTQTDILGAKIVYVITSIELNKKLDDALFVPGK